MDSPTTQTLRSIWGASASDVWAVGDVGTILHYDGTRWTAQVSGTTANLGRVWGVSPTEVYAAAAGNVILRYDGTSWSQFAGPPPIAGKLVNVWVASPTRAIASVNQDDAAFGADSILLWDGTSWTTEMRNAGDIKAVFLDPTGRGVAGKGISTSGGAFNDGSGWQPGFGFRTFSISGTSYDDFWVLSGTNGSSVHLVHWTGRTTNFTLTGDNLAHLPGWFVSTTEVYLFRPPVDAAGDRPLVRFTGSTSFPLTGIEESISGIAMWGASSSQLFVVGSGGHIYHKTP